MERKIEVKLIQWFDSRFYQIQYEENEKQIKDYYASTTTKLGASPKLWLAEWRGDIGNREANLRMNEAADRGKRIHNGWYILHNGGIVIYDPIEYSIYTDEEIIKLKAENTDNYAIIRYQDEMWALYKLQAFFKAVQPQVLGYEQIVYSLKYKEAGTVDNIYKIKGGEYEVNGAKPLFLEGGNYIIDVKSGKIVGKEAYMQMADYGEMWEEMGNEKLAGAIILHTESKNKSGIVGLSAKVRTREEMKEDFISFRKVAAVWEDNNKNASPKIFDFPSMLKFDK